MEDNEAKKYSKKFISDTLLHPRGLSSEHEKYYNEKDKQDRIDKLLSEFSIKFESLDLRLKQLEEKKEEALNERNEFTRIS